jgi:hypothetical protein
MSGTATGRAPSPVIAPISGDLNLRLQQVADAVTQANLAAIRAKSAADDASAAAAKSLPLAGGTMTGDLNMGGHAIVGVLHVVLTAPNGSHWQLSVDNTGALSTSSVP